MFIAAAYHSTLAVVLWDLLNCNLVTAALFTEHNTLQIWLGAGHTEWP